MRILTTDIYEGAYLLSSGMELSNIWEDKESYRPSIVFEFIGNNIEVLKDDYVMGRAKVNVYQYKNAMVKLKDIMFTLIRENGEKGEGKNDKGAKKIHRRAAARH